MSRLIASFYNLFVFHTEQHCLNRWRTSLLADATGNVLEIGAGTGLTIPCYPHTINQLTLAEPDQHMRQQLQKAANKQAIPTEIIASAGESLDLPTSHFDAIFFSLVLCSVADQIQVLSEAHRLLKPSGRLYFMEHVAAPDNTPRLHWQQRLEPIWKRLAGNCHLTRRTEQNILDTGFTIEQIVREEMFPAPFFIRPTIRGIAIKHA